MYMSVYSRNSLLLCVWGSRFITEIWRFIVGPVALHRETAGHWRLCSLSVEKTIVLHISLVLVKSRRNMKHGTRTRVNNDNKYLCSYLLCVLSTAENRCESKGTWTSTCVNSVNEYDTHPEHLSAVKSQFICRVWCLHVVLLYHLQTFSWAAQLY